MLRIIQNSAAAGAKSYYSTADYYSEGQELTGIWRGQGADRLGLSGEIAKEDWDALCDNKHPETGATLTARQKDNRRVGYDFNFHCPKSASLLYGLTGDERILEAFREAVGATMRDMEAEMQCRVRKDGKNEDRTTGNMIWGEFVHTTARPVDGVPDPHLHAHCFVFNTTWDGEEGRWKAGQFAGLKRDAPYFEAAFHARLAGKLSELGLRVERTKAGWELAGFSKATLAKFSRRTAQIEEKAREQGILDPGEKGELGAKTREAKRSELTAAELKELWAARLDEEEGGAIRAAQRRVGGEPEREDAEAPGRAVDWAILHCFERASVVPERTLLAAAMKRAYGEATPEAVAAELAARPLVRAEQGGRACVTTPEVLAEERAMIGFARDGRGACAALGAGDHEFKRDWLNAGQRKAVEHVLTSRDRVMLIRGAAGTGKTSMMQEAVEGIEAGGHKVFAFAPSADASRGVLREEGFAEADTVARLLLDERLQERIKGQVIWVDEAGLLSTRTTEQLFSLAGELGARVVLSGDRKQHGSVERGAALRLLEEEAGLVSAEIKEIQRQKADYKEAVRSLSEGRTADGFARLGRMGWVRELPGEERYRQLAGDYVATISQGKTALVVSPTHREGDLVTSTIRAELRARGRLGAVERDFESLTDAKLTEAERQDAANYAPGDVLVFHRNSKTHERGERVTVGAGPLPLDEAKQFQLYRPSLLALAEGDLIRITRNGKTLDGIHDLDNGTLYKIKDFDPNGNIVLANGWTVSRNYGHLDYGYCVTSHASQGKTVDRVFIGQSSESWGASSREQFYVSVSRGRQQAVIYTDDAAALKEAVEQSDDRVSATELARARAAAIRRSTEPLRAAGGDRQSERDARELVHG